MLPCPKAIAARKAAGLPQIPSTMPKKKDSPHKVTFTKWCPTIPTELPKEEAGLFVKYLESLGANDIINLMSPLAGL